MEDKQKEMMVKIIVSSLIAILIFIIIMIIVTNVVNNKKAEWPELENVDINFEPYIGEAIKGSHIKTLCTMVMANNHDKKNPKIAINGLTDLEDIKNMKENFEQSSLYDVFASYSQETKKLENITVVDSSVDLNRINDNEDVIEVVDQ